MPERTRHRAQLAGPGPGPGTWDELAAADADTNAMATVAHGPYAEALPVASP